MAAQPHAHHGGHDGQLEFARHVQRHEHLLQVFEVLHDDEVDAARVHLSARVTWIETHARDRS